jgi:hypothetical protein
MCRQRAVERLVLHADGNPFAAVKNMVTDMADRCLRAPWFGIASSTSLAPMKFNA